MIADVPDQLRALLRMERQRQWFMLALWSPALVLTFATLLVLEFSLITMGGLGQPLGPGGTIAPWKHKVFEVLMQVWGVSLLASPVLSLGSWFVRARLVRAMEARIVALPSGWQAHAQLRPGHVLGNYRLAASQPCLVRIETTPCSWLVRWMFEKFFFGGMVLLFFGIAMLGAQGKAALPGAGEIVLVVLVIGVPACLGGYLLSSIHWRIVRERGGALEQAQGLRVFQLPIVGGWRGRFVPANTNQHNTPDPPAWFLIPEHGLTHLDLWHVRMLRAEIVRAFPGIDHEPPASDEDDADETDEDCGEDDA